MNPRYVAMWSGPRNISTAMMRSWESRPDTYVCDEPLYAHYLTQTEFKHHPGYAETLANHEPDWCKIVSWLTGPIPENKTIFYQKQMAHHLLPMIPLDWTDQLTNCFLIRDPHEMLTSLLEFLPNPTAEHIGLPQQLKLFERIIQRTGIVPPVLDAKDVLHNPAHMLGQLCQRIDIAFDQRMLRWEPGPRETDGAWAPYWYKKVYKTTCFGQYKPKEKILPSTLRPVLAQCQQLYQALAKHRIQLPSTADFNQEQNASKI